MSEAHLFKDFTTRLSLFMEKYPTLATMVLSNIFTMRLVGNKTHGDLAEIAIAEFVNQYMYDFSANHVGKERFRAKTNEEDIEIINEISKEKFGISLKAYGDGPLQLSTDKKSQMFKRLDREGTDVIEGEIARRVLEEAAFEDFKRINVLPLIYREKSLCCNILVFDYEKAIREVSRIEKHIEGKGRKHPVFKFFNLNGEYICEVRYGDAEANALQRGLWTHTKNAKIYFDTITNGWIQYEINLSIIDLISHALVSSSTGHLNALDKIKEDIAYLTNSMSIVRQRA